MSRNAMNINTCMKIQNHTSGFYNFQYKSFAKKDEKSK